MKNVPFKRFLITRNGGMWGSEPGRDEFDALCIRVADFDYANLKTRATASTIRSITEKQLQKSQLHAGDILLEKSGGGEKTPVGRAVYYSGGNGAICSNFIERLSINREMLNPKFACYVLSAAYSQRKNLDCIKQTTGIQNLSIDDYLTSVTVPLFDLKTQQQITRWLDEHLAKVSQVITAKQAQLKKISSYRQSLITRAVTKGLNPNVELKDSGVEELGEIPSHWHVARLGMVCKLRDGTHFSPKIISEGYPYITAEDIHGEGIDYKNKKKISIEDYRRLVQENCRPHRDDVLLVKDGATTGRTGLMIDDAECVTLSSVAMLTPNTAIIDSRYLRYVLDSMSVQHQIQRTMMGAAMPRTTLSRLSRYWVTIPSLKEQKQITEFISKNIFAIDNAKSNIIRSIQKLTEYRSSLISAAVTGQLTIEEEASA